MNYGSSADAIGYYRSLRRSTLTAVHVVIVDNGSTPESVLTLVSACDGKILWYDAPSVLWLAGGNFNAHSAIGGHHGLGSRDGLAFSVPRLCGFVSGCCMFLRREVLESVGMLDASYFAYVEDADLCVRAQRAGFQVWYAPLGSATSLLLPQSDWH